VWRLVLVAARFVLVELGTGIDSANAAERVAYAVFVLEKDGRSA
jgi:hypothetical protein